MKSHHPYGDIRLRKYYDEKYSGSASIQNQSQKWGSERQLSMEICALNYFKKYNIGKEFN